jgi:hypothetical protein
MPFMVFHQTNKRSGKPRIEPPSPKLLAGAHASLPQSGRVPVISRPLKFVGARGWAVFYNKAGGGAI